MIKPLSLTTEQEYPIVSTPQVELMIIHYTSFLISVINNYLKHYWRYKKIIIFCCIKIIFEYTGFHIPLD